MSGQGKPYESIDCSHHDRLEAVIVTRQSCVLHHRDGQNETLRYTGRLADLVTDNGAEFVVTASGERVRLDHIVDLDGVSFE